MSRLINRSHIPIVRAIGRNLVVKRRKTIVEATLMIIFTGGGQIDPTLSPVLRPHHVLTNVHVIVMNMRYYNHFKHSITHYPGSIVVFLVSPCRCTCI